MKQEFEKARAPRRQTKMGEIFYSGGVAEALSSARFGTPKCLVRVESPTRREAEHVSHGTLVRSPHVKKAALGKSRGILGNQVIILD